MVTIKINGKTFNSKEGGSISIVNGQVTIDGVIQTGDKLSGVVKVEISGGLSNLKTDADVVVNGDVLGNVDAGGSVQCGAVGKSVDAGGSVQAGAVNGDVDAGGSVHCGQVSGSIDAGGSVRHG